MLEFASVRMIPPPKRHDLKSLELDFETMGYSPERRDWKSFHFESNGFSSDPWEIGVKQKHCISWSVVLAYLKSISFQNKSRFKNRLKLLPGGNDTDAEKVKSAILKFNPFMNKHSCCMDETLRELIRKFREMLDRTRRHRRNTNDVWPLIASTLECKILLISFRSEKARLFVPIPVTTSAPEDDGPRNNNLLIENNISSNSANPIQNQFHSSSATTVLPGDDSSIAASSETDIASTIRSKTTLSSDTSNATTMVSNAELSINKISASNDAFSVNLEWLFNDLVTSIAEKDLSTEEILVTKADLLSVTAPVSQIGLSTAKTCVEAADSSSGGIGEAKNDSSMDVVTITVFVSKTRDSNNDIKWRFNFGIKNVLCTKQRESAFRQILKTAEFTRKTIVDICTLVKSSGKEVSFIFALLQNESFHAILTELYRSPYIASKLANAGFETDPRTPGEDGFSAFYYALQSSEKNLLYILYSYAANSCYEFDRTFRDPNLGIVENFKKLKGIFEADRCKSKNFEILLNKKEQVRLRSKEILMFNERLSDISRGIHDIQAEEVTSRVEMASKQKRMILHILNKFDEYFSVLRISANEADHQLSELLEDYKKYKMYYDNLDITISLLFFDNIFRLKGLLSSAEPFLYSDLESSFLLLTLTRKHLSPQNDDNKDSRILIRQNSRFSTNLPNAHLLPLLERIQLRKEVKHFCEILESKEIRPKDTLDRIPEEEISNILSDFPEVKDEFLISRLRHYLGAALKKKGKGIMPKLVIERALQVLGECLKVEKDNPSSIRNLLRACVPQKTLLTLKHIRNKLCHLENSEYYNKFKAENDDPLFESIQEELLTIYTAFKVVFDIQKIKLINFITNRGLINLRKKLSCQVRKDHDDDPSLSLLTILENHRIELHQAKSFKRNMYRYLSYVIKETEARLDNPNLLKEADESIEENPSDILCPLEYLVNFLRRTFNMNQLSTGAIVLSSGEATAETSRETKSDLIADSKEILKNLCDSESLEIPPDIISVHIEKFEKIIIGYELSENDQREIRDDVPAHVHVQVESNKNLISYLEKEQVLTDEQISLFDNLFMKENKKKTLKKKYPKLTQSDLKLIKSSVTPIVPLDQLFSKKYVSDSKLKTMFNFVKFSDHIGDKIYAIARYSKEKPECDILGVLIDRISKLKEISFDESPDVQELWDDAPDTITKKYTIYNIVQRYFREPEFQASVEMLFFDCINILKDPDGSFNELWIKSSYLFNGIDVRNVLAHGDPLLETIGGFLDPDDLPSELVTKMLQLFEEEDSIRALHELWRTRNTIEADRKSGRIRALRQRITAIGVRWNTYYSTLSKAIPEEDSSAILSVIRWNRKKT